MGRLVLRRLALLVPTLALVSFAIFLLNAAVPGDAAQTLAGGSRSTPEQVEAMRERLHLDEPLLSQYGRWAAGAVRLDFGTSLYSGESIRDEIAARVPVTLTIAGAAALIGLALGVPLGVASGVRPAGIVDAIARFLASVSVASPPFLTASALVIFFSLRWKFFPTSGYTPLSEDPADWLHRSALPALALGLGCAAVVARQLRASLLDVLGSSHIRAAWARGASRRRVVGRHALRNAAIPALAAFGVYAGYLLGGSVIVEQIFAIPGLGLYMLRAVSRQDLPAIQGVTAVFVVCYVLLTLLLDIAFGLLNPKARVER